MSLKTKETSTNEKTLVNTLLISVGATVSKIMGFIREVTIAAFFGASYLVDAYLVALIIPQMLFSIIQKALTTTIIPMVTLIQEREGRESVLQMINTVTTVITAIVAVIIILGEIFSGIIVQLIAPGFSGQVFELTVSLNRVLLPMMLFMGLAGVGTGILQSQKRFLYPAFIGVPFNICIILSLLLCGHRWGITGLAIGTLIAVIAQWLFQIPDLRRVSFNYKLQLNTAHPGFRKIKDLMIPVIIGSGAGQISLLVDRMLASGLVEGSISALNFATRLNLLVYGILAVAVANAIYPDLAKAVVYENKNRLINSVSHSLNVILMIIMPIAIGMIILRYPLVRIVYQRGAFDSTDVALTAFALLFYALGLPALSLREVIFNAFYSLQDTLTPMYIGIGTVVLNIVLNLILVRYLEVGGLALATSITFTISFFLLITVLSKKVGSIQSKLIVITGSKIILASLIMGLGVFYFYSWAEQFIINKISEILIFSLSVFLGAILYFIIIKVLKIEEFDFIINLVKSKLAISK